MRDWLDWTRAVQQRATVAADLGQVALRRATQALRKLDQPCPKIIALGLRIGYPAYWWKIVNAFRAVPVTWVR